MSCKAKRDLPPLFRNYIIIFLRYPKNIKHIKKSTFRSNAFVYDGNVRPLQLQVLSCAIQLAFTPCRKLSAQEHQCSEALKTRQQILFARVNDAFTRISVTTCVSEPESFQRRVHAITGSDLRRQKVLWRECRRKEKWRLRSLCFTWPKLWHLGSWSGSRGTFLFLRVAAQGAPPPGLPHGE